MKMKTSLMCVLPAAALVATNCVNNPEGETQRAPESVFQKELTAEELKGGDFWDKVKFFQDADVPREKGQITPKGNFILKEGETKEGYIASSNTPWNFSGLGKTASAGAVYITTPYAFKHIGVIIGRYSLCQDSKKLPIDLNRGAGGQYIWLCGYEHPGYYGQVMDARTIDVVSRSSSSPPASIDVGFKGVDGSSNSDLNQGAGGRYIYGRYTKSEYYTSPNYEISGIGASYCDNWLDCLNLSDPDYGWSEDPTDMNDGAGGATLKFRYRH